MGYARAAEMIEFVGYQAALRDHLTYNLFPPIRTTLENLTLAEDAVDAVVRGEGNALVREHGPEAWEVVEAWHLEAFVDAIGPELVL